MNKNQYSLIRLRVTFCYGEDIADTVRKDYLFEFPEVAKITKRRIAKAFPKAKFEFAKITTTTITEAEL